MATVTARQAGRPSRLPWALWASSFALFVSGSVLVAINGDPILGNLGLGTIFASMGFSGALIASRQPENPIGWVLIGSTLVIALAFVTEGYSRYATEGRSTPLPGSMWAAWMSQLGMGSGDRPDHHAALPALPRRPAALAEVASGGRGLRGGHRGRRPVRRGQSAGRARRPRPQPDRDRRARPGGGRDRSGSGSWCSSCSGCSRRPRCSSGSDARAARNASRSSGSRSRRPSSRLGSRCQRSARA